MKNVIEMQAVSFFYNEICALWDINLTVENKEFLGIIGPNGGGKSTLLKLILGLLEPTSGKIRILGLPPDKVRGKIGYVPQFSKFDRRFPINVKDVVLMGRLKPHTSFCHRFNAEDYMIVDDIMRKVEVFDLRDRQISNLSGGQLQRVFIARALALKPEIILLDEPTASLDSYAKNHVCSILKELNENTTMIMVSHDMGVISSYVKSIACLNKELYYHGEPELTSAILGRTYGCPVDLIAHGVPHRVLSEHVEDQ
ncbi:MAG TPA: ABC transporter ATP-binding protein [Anaerovoracaceae bacterium]|nr:ABC transporter ATP-binding protein [Anaerovoracaceae bacterium]